MSVVAAEQRDKRLIDNQMRPGRTARAFFIAQDFPLSFRQIGLVIWDSDHGGRQRGIAGAS